MNIVTISVSIVAFLMLYGVLSMFDFPKIKLPTLGAYKNKRKEKKLLNVILKDMKKNAGNWVVQKKGLVMHDSNLMANDKKNMAVRYNSEGVTLYFNLKNIATLEKDTDDTLMTIIKGKQAAKFVNKAIRLLDHRGKELAYFTQKIEERL